jgi:hypothetical protein
MHAPLNPNASRRDLARFAMAIATTALVPVVAHADTSFNTAAALAHHPIIGRWLAVTALGPADLQCDAGGEAVITWPHSGDHATTGEYYEYFTSASGVWRPTSATEFDMAIVVGDTDEAGLVIGATVLESHAIVDAGGSAFRASGESDRLLRASFAANFALDLITSLAPLSGIRMWAEE